MDGPAPAPDILARLRAGLAGGDLAPDGRLPPERELAARFGVNRGTIRKAMALLEAEGRIHRHVGRGTFARRAAPPGASSIPEIAERTSPPAAMEARMILEPELARLAAFRATAADVAELRRLAAVMRAAKSWAAYEEADYLFHHRIAEAAGNGLLLEVERLVNGVRRSVVWGHLALRAAGPAPDYHSFDEHDAILEAIAARDRRGAAEAMRRHLDGTARALADDAR